MPPALPTHSSTRSTPEPRWLLAACCALLPCPSAAHPSGRAPHRAPASSRYLQHELVGLTQLAGVLLVALEALHLLPIRGVEQELLDVRGLQAVRLHRHQDLAQLHVRELEVGDQDGCGEGWASAGGQGLGCLAGWSQEGKQNLSAVREQPGLCAPTLPRAAVGGGRVSAPRGPAEAAGVAQESLIPALTPARLLQNISSTSPACPSGKLWKLETVPRASPTATSLQPGEPGAHRSHPALPVLLPTTSTGDVALPPPWCTGQPHTLLFPCPLEANEPHPIPLPRPPARAKPSLGALAAASAGL